jgi:uncharacterized protein (UPF0264 family)
MTRLLVSVRNAEEAELALSGGADLVDVKEPSRGSLGRADEPVSAALGELRDWQGGLPPIGLAYVKWGFAGYGGSERWREDLMEAIGAVGDALPGCAFVAVVYADWQSALAPKPSEIIELAIQLDCHLLVDTWKKDGATLLEWMNYHEIGNVCRRCRDSNRFVALAGSLGVKEIESLSPLRPDWIAVRGAACALGDRTSGIVSDRVRELKKLLR